MDEPLCECHGEPMRWCRDDRKKKGGRWACRVMLTEINRRYQDSPKGRARSARYRASTGHREAQRRYAGTAKGRDTAWRHVVTKRNRRSAQDRETIEALLEQLGGV